MERKAVWGSGDDSAGFHAGFANHVPYEFKVDRVARIWEFRPFRLEKFQAPAGVHNEIDFASAVTPEEEAAQAPGATLAIPQLGKDERLPYCACRGRLPKIFLGPNVQKSAKQPCIRKYVQNRRCNRIFCII
jgi:hypothetical protein